MANTSHLGKGLKQLGILVFLFISGPILLSIAFKAIKIYTEGSAKLFSYAFLILACILMLFAIFFAFKTFKTIIKAIFQD